MWPVPASFQITTPWGRRGMMWSCNKTSQGGVHTGCDFAAPLGTPIYAPISGTIRHRNYGKAFGPYQFAISPDPGAPFGAGEVFFAHVLSRPADGMQVMAGTKISEVGNLGNASGPHLHMEYHPSVKNVWNCSVHADPAPVLAWRQVAASVPAESSWHYPAGTKIYGKFLKWHGHELNSDGKSTSIGAWQDMLNHHKLAGGVNLPLSEAWHEMTAAETQKCQTQHVPPFDTPLEAVFVGPKQFAHVMLVTKCPYVWVSDSASTPEPQPPVVVSERPPVPAILLPGATWDPIPKTGGGYFMGLRSFSGSAKKITLHTTESSAKPNWEVQQSGIPHLTVDLNEGRVWQHLPFTMAAYTLKGADHSPNADGGVNIQIEIVGRAASVPSWSTGYYTALRSILVAVCGVTSVPFEFPLPFGDQNASIRESWETWASMSGIMGHGHVPYNDHWDPGLLDSSRLLDVPHVNPPVEERTVTVRVDEIQAIITSLQALLS